MSDAALTDSTTPRLAYWRTVAPFSGSSTNTTSPSCSCAKCVMPIVATSPSARTHSCSFEYWRLSGTVLTRASGTTVSLREPPVREGSLRDPSVKRCLHYRSGNVLAANADGQGRSDLRKRRRHVGQRDVLFDRRPVRAARDLADDVAVLRDLVPVARDPALDHETGDLPLRSGGLFRRDHIAPDEGLVQLARPAEARLDRVGGLVDVVPIEREARLQTQRVAGSQADRLDPGLAPGRKQAVPHRGRIGVGHEHLEAVLAGVSGARQGRASSGHAPLRDAEGRERANVGVCLGCEDLHRARALDRDERGPERAIVERDVLAQVRENMGSVLSDV